MGKARQQVDGSTIAVAAALFVALTVWRFADPNPLRAIAFLYVIPIALVASRFGKRGGLAGAVVASALTIWWGETHNQVVLGPQGYLVRATAFVAVGLVIAWQVERRKTVEAEADRWFSMSDEMCCVASRDGRFTRVNAAWTRWLGYDERDLLGRPFVAFVHPDDADLTNAEAAAVSSEPDATVDFENRYRAKDGSWHWLHWSARSDGKCIYAAARDITDRKRLEANLVAMAVEDQLTGLPNRRAWDQRVAEEGRRAARTGEPLAVAMLDLDNLKTVNDTDGHAAGDRLLTGCAAAWNDAIRESDFIARLGGDEFGLLLPASDLAEAGEVIERMRAATPPGASFSAGIAELGSGTAGACIQQADEALYRAKAEGRGSTVAAQ